MTQQHGSLPIDSKAPTPARSVVFGVLGGIASGKSQVARLLAGGSTGLVLDADSLAREILHSPEVIQKLEQRFGTCVLDAKGQPDREAIGRIVFADAEARRELESWIHPGVRQRLHSDLSAARSQGVRRIVLDVPLLIENDAQHDLRRWCDVLVFVDSEPADRDARASASRGWTSGEVARREALQHPLEEKRALAHFVIENRGTTSQLESAVQSLLRTLGLS